MMIRPVKDIKLDLGEARASNVQVQIIWLLAYFWTYVFWTNHTSLENLETKKNKEIMTSFMWLPKQNYFYSVINHVAPLVALFLKLHFKL